MQVMTLFSGSEDKNSTFTFMYLSYTKAGGNDAVSVPHERSSSYSADAAFRKAFPQSGSAAFPEMSAGFPKFFPISKRSLCRLLR
jgi:hypothetical protein